jgi:hypothetical protein
MAHSTLAPASVLKSSFLIDALFKVYRRINVGPCTLVQFVPISLPFIIHKISSYFEHKTLSCRPKVVGASNKSLGSSFKSFEVCILDCGQNTTASMLPNYFGFVVFGPFDCIAAFKALAGPFLWKSQSPSF